ncbi:hypothetical protein DL770_006897 [Monosporascus sp. CRB-9-2]|nr:hypothetical protein DL770_006897 [Monosporascus sp. CRB-9-2]
MASDEELVMSKPNVGSSHAKSAPLQPSLPWRLTSSVVMGLTAALSRGFIYTFNSVEVTGLQKFLNLLDKRKDVEGRERGLITVSNHISMAFGSFFYSGQVLPTHRSLHSPHGGLFQPTIPQAIRLLSSQPFITPRPYDAEKLLEGNVPDPFTAGDGLTFTTTGADRHTAPSAYRANRHSWVHVFPEACVHQHPTASMRYFKWGVSRLILESEPMPDVVPVFIDGTQRVMPEDRGFPRFLPRVGVGIRVAFGDLVDAERTFGDLRARWRDLVRRANGNGGGGKAKPRVMGELTDELKYGPEAVEIRVECARRVREEIVKLRRSLGYPEEEPGFELAERWVRDPAKDKFKSGVDESLVNKKE